MSYADAHKQVTDALKLEKTVITIDEEPQSMFQIDKQQGIVQENQSFTIMCQ